MRVSLVIAPVLAALYASGASLMAFCPALESPVPSEIPCSAAHEISFPVFDATDHAPLIATVPAVFVAENVGIKEEMSIPALMFAAAVGWFSSNAVHAAIHPRKASEPSRFTSSGVFSETKVQACLALFSA